MSKIYKIILGFLVILLGLSLYMEASRKDALDWSPTYAVKDKNPLGGYVFYHSLKEQSKNFKIVDQPPYTFLQDSTRSGTYVFIDDKLMLNKTATQRLLDWVKKGNTLFIAANYTTLFDYDSLHLQQRKKMRRNSLINYPQFNLSNPELKADSGYVFKHNTGLHYFKQIDTLNQTVLGEAYLKKDSLNKSKGEVNFIAVPLGKGELILHSSPAAFSNFFMLSKQNYRYVEKVLAYLNLESTVFYDVYFDPSYNDDQAKNRSPLYVLFGNKYLKWGYYFILIGAFLFVVFKGKRKQKAIEEILPLENKTYEYTRTISGMYLARKDHTSIAHKKINQFSVFLQQELRTDLETSNEAFVNHLFQLTHYSKPELKSLLKLIQYLRKKKVVTKQELIALNKKINNFKKNC